MNKIRSYKCDYWLFVAIITIAYLAAFTLIDFSDASFSTYVGFIKQVARFLATAMGVAGIMILLSISRIVFVCTYPLLILASTVLAYYNLTLGITFTANIFDLMIVNDVGVWSTVIDIRIILFAILALVFSFVVSLYRWKCVDKPQYTLWYIIAGAVFVLCPNMIQRVQINLMLRSPFCFYYGIKDYFHNKIVINSERDVLSSVELSQGAERPDVVVILGESLRADHLGLNGYYRQTTPNLQSTENIVSYPYVTTELYSTHLCLPVILTRATSDHLEIGGREESFITLFNRAGYNSYWISNQDKNPAYVYFMNEADSLRVIPNGWTIHNVKDIGDMYMLPYIEEFFNAKKDPQLLVVHSLGSHWVYNYNCPDSLKKFLPEANSQIPSEVEPERLNNSYDNTVIAMDDFVSKIIHKLKNRNAFVVFIADHGEALGENGKYLHGIASKETASVACFFWYSQKYLQAFPEKVRNLKENANKPWKNDMIFHSVLDAADFKTSIIDYSQSILSIDK